MKTAQDVQANNRLKVTKSRYHTYIDENISFCTQLLFLHVLYINLADSSDPPSLACVIL